MGRRDYYVYVWKNSLTGKVFYVGKGTKGRCYRTDDSSHRNPYFKNYLNKHYCHVEKIYMNLTEEVAFYLEKQAISEYRELGQAQCNFTDGGEGASGMILSEETKAKIREYHNRPDVKAAKSERVKGEKNPMYGNHRFAGKNNPMYGLYLDDSPKAKPVICIDTGVIYGSMKGASKSTGVNYSQLSSCCNGKGKTAGGYKWRYATEEEIQQYKDSNDYKEENK